MEVFFVHNQIKKSTLIFNKMNFRSMADMLKDKDKNKKKNPKKTESYTGGEKSGLAVENNANDDLSSIIAQAKKNSESILLQKLFK